MEQPSDSRRQSTTSTPLMKAIQEEDSPLSPELSFKTPYLDGTQNISSSNLLGDGLNSTARPFFTSPALSRPSSTFYSAKDGNNSSSSIIYNPSFTFGGNASNNGNSTLPNPPPNRDNRRNSKYVPGNKLAPPQRTRSPIRSGSPDIINNTNNSVSKRGSLILESPFNFAAPQLNTQKGQSHQQTPPSSASRASFRKGHRYKHSSVSMNFFQEPEVKIPLNIAKSLPIPELNDLKENLQPRAYFQLGIVSLQLILCFLTFQLGHTKSWTNFSTLSHFITYDMIGSLGIILVENLSQFEVWFTGTLTFPFGLNRADVLLSFALAVSLCFVGLDLIFHILEETIVLFVESETPDHHDDIAPQIPHSHHASKLNLGDNDYLLWYGILFINLLLSTLALFKIFYANKNSKLKTKNSIITISYTIYLFIYPALFGILSSIADYVTPVIIAIFILMHGLTITEWTSTILLMGFSTTTISGLALIDQNSTEKHNINNDTSETKATKTRIRSFSSLPVATNKNLTEKSSTNLFSLFRLKRPSEFEPTSIKSVVKEQIENLNEFKARCNLDYNDLIITKVNFNLFVILIKITMKGGSNDDELELRLAVEKCLQRYLPHSETTVEIDRL